MHICLVTCVYVYVCVHMCVCACVYMCVCACPDSGHLVELGRAGVTSVLVVLANNGDTHAGVACTHKNLKPEVSAIFHGPTLLLGLSCLAYINSKLANQLSSIPWLGQVAGISHGVWGSWTGSLMAH